MSNGDPSPDPPGDDLLDDVTVGADDEVLARIRAQLKARGDADGSASEPSVSEPGVSEPGVSEPGAADGFAPDDDPTIGAVELPEVLRERRGAEPPPAARPAEQVGPRGQPRRTPAPQGEPPGQARHDRPPGRPGSLPPHGQRLRAQPPAQPSVTGPGMPGRAAAPRSNPGRQLLLPEESTTLGWRPPERRPRSRDPEPTAKPPSRTWLVPLIAAVVVAAIVAVVVLL